MNYYVVVEGEGDKTVYSRWIPVLFPHLSEVEELSALVQDNFLLVEGRGYPNVMKRIEAGVHDVHTLGPDCRLIAAVDSEESTHEDRRAEVDARIANTGIAVNYRIIVQHFCIEAWGLGNRGIVPKKPRTERLRKCTAHYNVVINDPEQMTSPSWFEYGRARFAKRYLHDVIEESNHKGKSNSAVMSHEKYLREVVDRQRRTLHIPSFAALSAAFT